MKSIQIARNLLKFVPVMLMGIGAQVSDAKDVLKLKDWSGREKVLFLEDNEGEKGGEALKMAKKSPGRYRAVNYKHPYTKEELEGRYQVNFMVRLDHEPGESHGPAVFLRVFYESNGDLSGSPFRLNLKNNGRLTFFSNDEEMPVLDRSGEIFIMQEGEYFPVELVVDFSDQIFRLRVDGVDQETETGDEKLKFNSSYQVNVGMIHISTREEEDYLPFTFEGFEIERKGGAQKEKESNDSPAYN